MSREKRTITNGSGKSLSMMIDPEATNQHIHSVEWVVTPAQWRRLKAESDDSAWKTERGAIIAWTCYPHACECKRPGRA